MSGADPWEGVLGVGEDILWQDRPDGAIAPTRSDYFLVAFLILLPAYFFWDSWDGLMRQPWLTGVVFSYFPAMIFWTVFRRPVIRRHSWYMLTRHRALIAIQLPLFGRMLWSYPVGEWTTLAFNEGPLAEVYFTTRLILTEKRGFRRIPSGFERIPNGSEVGQIMQELQNIHREEKALP